MPLSLFFILCLCFHLDIFFWPILCSLLPFSTLSNLLVNTPIGLHFNSYVFTSRTFWLVFIVPSFLCKLPYFHLILSIETLTIVILTYSSLNHYLLKIHHDFPITHTHTSQHLLLGLDGHVWFFNCIYYEIPQPLFFMLCMTW